MAKFGMSMVVLGLAGEQRRKYRGQRAVAAHHHCDRGDQESARRRRHHAHVAQAGDSADAAYFIFHKPKSFTGNFLIDDTFLAGEGVTRFLQYRVDPSQPLSVDFFVPDNIPPPPTVSLKALG